MPDMAQDQDVVVRSPIDDSATPEPAPENEPAPEAEAETLTPPPPLPPRPRLPGAPPADGAANKMQARPTTALSSVDIQTMSFPDGSRGTFSSSSPSAQLASGGYATPMAPDDSVSVMTFVPTLRAPGDLESLINRELSAKSRAWQLLRAQSATRPPFEAAAAGLGAQDELAGFAREFDGLYDAASSGAQDEEALLRVWKAKLKHYLILSSAGKPIWSRHGDPSLINSYIGVVQTIISFYEGAKDPLQGFTAGGTRFVIAIEGPLYFVAISRLGESDSQLRGQLDALYMQILSTLTLPTLTNIFVHRPSSDLSKPLQGTESLLSALADSFTRGSSSALLGALECLKLRKSQRHAINNAFLKQRSEKLLYGLIVAGGKLVSVIRPRRHSLHPSDLELIFNMLFASDSIKAGGGENWIPLCLPAFNNSGYLYMYVSFFDKPDADSSEDPRADPPPAGPAASLAPEDEIAIILISPDRESFFELKEMRDKVAQNLGKNGGLALIRAAAAAGRPRVSEVAPGSQIAHFLYKSRANVQFVSSTLDEPAFADVVARRRLSTLYHRLHASAHARHSHLRVLHCSGEDSTSLAWVTPVFEFYCVAGPNSSRAAMSQGANRIVQWAKREEERLFIVGGGVF